MGRGKFKAKPTGRRSFSNPEELDEGSSARPRAFKQEKTEYDKQAESESEESGENSEEVIERRKGSIPFIEIQNPNLVKPKTSNKEVNLEKTTELSRREREEIEKQRAHERYMRLQEQGKTEQSRKDLERLALIRRQREAAAKKREAEKAAKELKKTETRM